MMNKIEDINELSEKIINHWAINDAKQLGLQACTIATQLAIEKEKLAYAVEQLTYIIQKVAHSRCDYCILQTEPCPARGLNAECPFEYCGRQSEK